MKISVVITTYNGSKYLYDQINSILNQTHLPNEIIVSDDNSEDNTLDIINSFKSNSLIKINQNFKRLGFVKNFEKAISLTSGDLIFLSDQDDFWESHKIEFILNKFKNDKSIFLTINNATLTDSKLKKTNTLRAKCFI